MIDQPAQIGSVIKRVIARDAIDESIPKDCLIVVIILSDAQDQHNRAVLDHNII